MTEARDRSAWQAAAAPYTFSVKISEGLLLMVLSIVVKRKLLRKRKYPSEDYSAKKKNKMDKIDT